MLIEINILVQSDNRLGEDMLIFATCHTYSEGFATKQHSNLYEYDTSLLVE